MIRSRASGVHRELRLLYIAISAITFFSVSKSSGAGWAAHISQQIDQLRLELRAAPRHSTVFSSRGKRVIARACLELEIDLFC